MAQDQTLFAAQDPLDDQSSKIPASMNAGGGGNGAQTTSNQLLGQNSGVTGLLGSGNASSQGLMGHSTAATQGSQTNGGASSVVLSGTGKQDEGAQGEEESSNSALNIPPEMSEKFGELIELIKGSKSMDDEERQYWIDVLPIMSADQIGNLRGILDNEKKQLAAATKAYSDGVNEAAKKAAKAFDEEAYLEKKRVREEAEKRHEVEEVNAEANALAELQAL